MPRFPDDWSSIPSQHRQVVEHQLAAGETVLAAFVSDVSEQRQYEESCVVLTDSRVFEVGNGTLRKSWSLPEIDKLRTRDRSGLGSLELLGADRLLACWHYTIGRANAALVMVDRLHHLQSGQLAVSQKPAEEADIPEAEETGPKPSAKALLRLGTFARPWSFWIVLGVCLSLASTAVSFAPPILTRGLIRDVLEPFEHHQNDLQATDASLLAKVPVYLGMMLVAAIVTWLLAWAQGAILAFVAERVTADLRDKTYAHLQKLSLEFFGGKRTGDLMSRISTDSDRLTAFLSDSLVDFIADVMLVLGTIVVLVYFDPLSAMATLLPCPVIAWLMYRSRDTLQTGFQSSGRAWSALNSVLADTIPGIRVVKAFAQEKREIERFQKANKQIVAANESVNWVWTLFWPTIKLLNEVGVLIVLAFSIWRISQNRLAVADLWLFLPLVSRFYGRLETMSRMVNTSQRAAASAQRIFEVLDRVSSVPEPAHPVSVENLRGDLEFRKVGFRYGNRKVIHDLTLHIPPGEMLGLVGHTGAGKSTMINLVCRFFDVAEGAILVDGHDIRSYRVQEHRRNVGIVLQDPFLFFGSIAENIAYGRPTATREEIITAAKAARAHEFILQLPDGYDSLVGERGQSLSGGERQRISIARALLIDPKILILDEATSALDSQTEREIQAALQNLVKGRTTIAIAHRLSTLRQANRIMVLERGRLVEIGTHEELLAKNGAFAKLHRAQQQMTQDIAW